jgi:EmrB/QacA subfamily drug resistance transporter
MSESLKVLIIVCLGTFFHIQSIGSINVSLPAIQKEFGTSLAAIQWIGLMGSIMISSFSLAFGRAGDRLGRKKIFNAGLALYTVGAGLASLSPSFAHLIASRLVMASGLAMAAPMAGAIVAVAYPHESRGRALGWLAFSIALGRVTGPTVGGLVLELWGWRAVFLANALFGVATCAILFRVRRGVEERSERGFDLPGAITLGLGFPALLLALSAGPRSGWLALETWSWLALAAGALAGFVRAELRAEAPLMRLSHFRNATLAAAILSLVLGAMVYYPVSIFGPLYMRLALGAPEWTVGLVMAALPFSTALFSTLSGRLADRFHPRWTATLGLALVAVGVAFYARLDSSAALGWIVAVLSLIGAGVGFFVPANEKLAFSTVESRDYGMLSAMLTSFGTGSGAVGTALAVALAEASRKSRGVADSAGFAEDQRFAFLVLLPLAAVAVAVTLAGRERSPHGK